ncbi:MAG: hypothetical protein KC474_10930 [Cyanobacteria bacterium HKST-UBA04]|nr:hypothetical protein [Cyanobacteria bacterium HKST-UBA04]
MAFSVSPLRHPHAQPAFGRVILREWEHHAGVDPNHAHTPIELRNRDTRESRLVFELTGDDRIDGFVSHVTLEGDSLHKTLDITLHDSKNRNVSPDLYPNAVSSLFNRIMKKRFETPDWHETLQHYLQRYGSHGDHDRLDAPETVDEQTLRQQMGEPKTVVEDAVAHLRSLQRVITAREKLDTMPDDPDALNGAVDAMADQWPSQPSASPAHSPDAEPDPDTAAATQWLLDRFREEHTGLSEPPENAFEELAMALDGVGSDGQDNGFNNGFGDNHNPFWSSAALRRGKPR